MKITIKILPLVLAVALCLSLAATALAANSTNPQELSDSANIDAEAFLPILNAAASDAASFGYTDEDFSSLSIGLPIHAYEYLDTGVFRETDFVYYPIFSKGQPILLVLENEDGLTQVSKAFIDVLSAFVGDSVAIIYDIDQTYIISASGEAKVACEYEAASNERGQFSYTPKIPQYDTVKLTPFAEYIPLPSLSSIVQPCYDPNMPTVKLDVPVVLQVYDNICWAACTAAIGNYLSGRNHTALHVAIIRYGSHDFNRGGYLSDSLYMLSTICGISYTFSSDDAAPSDSRIYANLSAGYPIFAKWTFFYAGEAYFSHQTVIRGMNPMAGYQSPPYLYIMEPMEGYVTVRGSSDGTYSITGEDGFTYTLAGYGAML